MSGTATAAPTAGASGVPGDPGTLRGAAHTFSAAAARLEAIAGDVNATARGLTGEWSGPASWAAGALVATLSKDLERGNGAFTLAAGTLMQLADAIEAAQRRAAAALQAAAEADAHADWLGITSDGVPGPPPTAKIDELRGEADVSRSAAAAAAVDAELAAQAAAGAFARIAAMAPEPPPPPQPAQGHGGHEGTLGKIGGFFTSLPGKAKSAYDGANHLIDEGQAKMDGLVHTATGYLPGPLRDAANTAYEWSPMSPKFSIDFAQGVGDWGVGVIQATPMLIRLTPQYGMFDPAGQARQQHELAQGLSYAWDHKGETFKQVIGWQHVENGEPGRAIGQAAPDVALTILSGGGGAGLKVATTTERTVEVASDLSRAERLAEGASAVERRAGSIREVNPGYPMPGRVNNCINCAVATDARLSGGKAVALPGEAGPIGKLEDMYGGRFQPVASPDALAQQLQAAGPGARGIVFGQRLHGVGHVFNAINQRGTVRFLDGQVGGPASFDGFDRLYFLRTDGGG